MSGQWEVVGRKKGKDSTQPKKSGGENKKNHIPNTPKVEEVLPLQQVKNLYSVPKNKENRKPQEKKVQENGNKKTQKKTDKSQEVPKPKPPKSIESALNSIDVEELKSIYEERVNLFPKAPIIWLKDIAQFLNQRIPIDIQDPTFSSKPEGYPFSVVPTPLKNLIDQSIKEAGTSNVQAFFDLALTTMTNDMSKNLHTLGHKLYIQHLAITQPNFVVASLNRHVTLRNSYQNRPVIGLSILWALGQAGISDFHIGLKVFQEIMLPIIELKNYSRYIIQYLIALINRHSTVHINTDQCLLILDVAFANYKNFPNDLRQELLKAVSNLQDMLLHNSAKFHTLVEPLLKKLLSNNNKAYKKEICETLVECLCRDQSAFGSWSKCYTKSLSESAILLNYIDDNWKTISVKFNNKVFVNLLNTFCATNEELLTKKRKEPGLVDAEIAIKRLKDKMNSKKKSGFSYKFFSSILIIIIGGVIYYDIQQHGSWERSRTYIALKQSGILECANKATERSLEGINWLHLRIDEQVPGYYQKSSEYVHPYVEVTRDVGLVLANIFNNFKNTAIEKYPIVLASIESYAPGVIEGSQKLVSDAWSTSILYFHRSMDYLKTEVFVGHLAPENMQKVVLEAFNTTQQKAVECYQWVYEKVQSSMK